MCRHWREVETNSGRGVEHCEATRRNVACCGTLAQCQHPNFFNVPRHRWALVRRLEAENQGGIVWESNGSK